MIFDMNYIKGILSKKSRTGHFFQNFKYSPVFFYPAFGVKKKPGRGKKKPDPEMYENIEGYMCIVVFYM